MSKKMKRINVDLDSETAQLVESAAARKGVSVEQFCTGAVHNELSQETAVRKFSAEGMIAAGETIFRGRLSVTDSADLIREAREERHRDAEYLASLFAACDEITGGRTSLTDSSELIREAREERHRDVDQNGSP